MKTATKNKLFWIAVAIIMLSAAISTVNSVIEIVRYLGVLWKR